MGSGLHSRSYLENQMAVALGGRVAEEIIFGKEFVTTGASNDFQQVSRVARSMIVNYGFSDKVGQVSMSSQGGNPFLGQSAGQSADYSAYTADIIDGEVKALVEKAYTRAMDLCMTHIDVLHKTADALIEKELGSPAYEGQRVAMKKPSENDVASLSADDAETVSRIRDTTAENAVELIQLEDDATLEDGLQDSVADWPRGH